MLHPHSAFGHIRFLLGHRLTCLVALASLLACGGDGAGPSDPVTITGSFLLSTVNGTPLPFDLIGPGGVARITGATLRLNPNGRYTTALTARIDLGPGPVWGVERGKGTFTTPGNTIRFSDSGDGDGPFTATVNGNQLTFVDAGVTLVFVRGAAIDEVTVTPAQADLTSCLPLQLSAAAVDTATGPVQNPPIIWQSSNQAIATVDGSGLVTAQGAGTVSIFATAGSGVDSTVVDVAFAVPSPVTLQSVVWENGYPRLTWTPAPAAGFCYYRVVVSGNWGGNPGASDSIGNAATTTFLDTRMPGLYGLSLDYGIQVHNGGQVASSQTVHLEFGSSIPIVPITDRVARPRVSPTRDELYLQGGTSVSTALNDTLKTVSTVSNTVIAERFVGRAAFTVSADGASLYVISPFPAFQIDSLFTLDPGTLAQVTAAELPFTTPASAGMAAGRAGRVYVEHDDFLTGESSVKVVDIGTGAEVGAVIVSTDPSLLTVPMQLAVSPDHNTLYAVKYRHVWKIDVTSDNVSVADSLVTSLEVQAMQLSPGGARLYLAHALPIPSFIEIWDAATLSFISRLAVPALFDFYATGSDIFVSQSNGGRPGDLYFLSGDVVRYNATSLAAVESWGVVKVGAWVIASRDGTGVYLDGPAANTLFIPVN